jgi:hypothetical protein
MLKREKGALEEQAKRDAVERSKAKDAYRRLVTLRGIEEKMAKSEVRAHSKAEAARLRREMNAAALRQKHKVLQTMESMAMQGKMDFEGAQVRARAAAHKCNARARTLSRPSFFSCPPSPLHPAARVCRAAHQRHAVRGKGHPGAAAGL